ncbi:3-oxoacyl-[acyl-carrier-protein] reductase FabG [Yarrowia sp. B02]|nr:3-oxoacyl-[acyl-carrier-protein] reductase FabG [Yarrowia sp. B02]
MGELSGKTAVVSGGSGGIGFAICTKFAENGAKVIILDYNKEAIDEVLPTLVAPEGQKHEGHFYDVTKDDKPPVDFSQVDILLNGAGVGDGGFLESMENSLIERIIATNLTGTIKLTKYALEAWWERADSRTKAQGNGVVINIASILGLRAVSPALTVYSASKGGIIMFTKALAIEGGAQQIRANAICPGYVKTNMTEFMELPDPSPFQEIDDTGDVSRESIAGAAYYFATNLQVSGAVLSVDKAMCAL